MMSIILIMIMIMIILIPMKLIGLVAPLPTNVEYLKVTVTMMMIAVVISYAEQITVLLHSTTMQIAAMTHFPVSTYLTSPHNRVLH